MSQIIIKRRTAHLANCTVFTRSDNQYIRTHQFYSSINHQEHLPANICWSWRHLEDVFKTCLQHVFSVTIFCLLRRLEDMSSRRLQDMSWKRLEDMSWRYLADISWRRLEDTMETNKIFTRDICIYQI